MLVLTTKVTRRNRSSSGGTMYVLEPLASQIAVPGHAGLPQPDVSGMHIGVYDTEEATSLLKLFRVERPLCATGATQLNLLSFARFNAAILIGQQTSAFYLADLDQAFASSDLLVSLSFEGVFEGEDNLRFARWLLGEQSASDLLLRGQRLPELALVKRT